MKFNYGGQAVLEGVMMRGQRHMAVAVRAPNGEIILKTEPLQSKIYTSKLWRLPFMRGLVSLWDALVLGTQTLFFSANVAMLDPDAPQGSEQNVDTEQISGWALWSTMAFSLLFAIGLFFAAPPFIATLAFSWTDQHIAVNIAEGVIRLAIFMGYLWLMGKMPDVRRVFMYHGAEHKTINAYEADAKLEPETVQTFTTVHTRCGTSFLLVVLVVASVIFVFMGDLSFIWKLVSRIFIIPLVATGAYEFLRFTAANYRFRVVRWLAAPGLALQKMTTRQPELPMLEIAIVALEHVLAADGIISQEEYEARRLRLPVRPAQPVRGNSGAAA
ncbi:DUF1385 domain-containing protein [Candidatus Chlorohelix allophototropha]|uniref:DUF1385 domain-containing protein n=1 Tax=Candidatus Chlorohelix allophototropha TaxID=3003348 RepID=A0ABY9B6Y8_9CHLR|nr:DUF1385 domain-containing protein [Chloroflexota bacterium L227-S17]